MLLLWALSGCVEAPAEARWCTLSGQALGTTWTVKWRTDARVCEDKPVDLGLQDVLAEVDRQMSTWRPDSEIMRARSAPGPVEVSEATADVVREALELAAATDGAFDPTVQPLMEVWGFHSASRTITPPTPEALDQARAKVGWERVSVSYEAGVPQVHTGGTALDLSAIAKGHAVDRMSGWMSGFSLPDHMVEVGGEVRVAGRGPQGAWTLGVDAPEEGAAPGERFAAVLSFHNAALATSGNYRNLVEVEGRKVHHTMDPRTGQPAESPVASASVIAPDCRTADALATALMVLDPASGLALIERRDDTEALVLVSEPAGLTMKTSSGMDRYIAR